MEKADTHFTRKIILRNEVWKENQSKIENFIYNHRVFTIKNCAFRLEARTSRSFPENISYTPFENIKYIISNIPIKYLHDKTHILNKTVSSTIFSWKRSIIFEFLRIIFVNELYIIVWFSLKSLTLVILV